MNEPRRLIRWTSPVLMLIALVACQPAESGDDPAPIDEATGADMANPAAVYCEGLGYRMEPRENAAGMDAACIFPDGTECGQWDFLAGRCGQQYTYCLQHTGARLDEGANIGTCVFEDRSTCDEFTFYRGECQPGDNPAEDGETDGN